MDGYSLKVKSYLFEEVTKRTRCDTDDNKHDKDTSDAGAVNLKDKIQSELASHVALLFEEDRDLIFQGLKLIFHYFTIPEKYGIDFTREIPFIPENLFDAVIQVWSTNDCPDIMELATGILAELEYRKPIDLNEEKATFLADRSIDLLSWGDENLSISALILMANVTCDYPRFGHLLLDRCILAEDVWKPVIYADKTRDMEKIICEIANLVFVLSRNPLCSEDHWQQIVYSTRSLISYNIPEAIVYGFKIIQALTQNEYEFPIGPPDIERFEVLSAACKWPSVIIEMLRMIRIFPNDEIVERILTETFLNNLAIVVLKGSTDLVCYVLKFMAYITPWTRPIGSDLIIPITCIKIDHSSYHGVYYGLKFFRKICHQNDFLLKNLISIGVLQAIAPSLVHFGESKLSEIAMDLVMMIAALSDRCGIALAEEMGYESVVVALEEIDRSELTEEQEARLNDVERYFQ